MRDIIGNIPTADVNPEQIEKSLIGVQDSPDLFGR